MPFAIDSLINASKMISTSITNGTQKTPFSNKGIDDMNSGQFLMFCFILFILTYFIMFIGAMCFNMSVVKLKIFPTLKEITTIDFLLLYISTHLLFC
jgi:hypothetical protein